MPGIGRRLDDGLNHDLNVRARSSAASAPDLSPFQEMLQVDEASVKKVFAAWGPKSSMLSLISMGKASAQMAKTSHAKPCSAWPCRRQQSYLDWLVG